MRGDGGGIMKLGRVDGENMILRKKPFWGKKEEGKALP